MASSDRRATRIIDASLNRAAEGLRVVEDICRFAWELPGLSAELKEMRHALLKAFAPTPGSRARQVLSRDIEEDVGREIAIASPPGLDLGSLAARNLERAKEALRSLEEVARLGEPAGSREAAALRYRLYSIEKAVWALAAPRRRNRLSEVKLYLVLGDGLARLPLPEAAKAAIAGGVDAVQLREKRRDDRELLALGRTVREITARAGVPFIVNDRPELALLLGADGVHLGQRDLPVAAARRILGTEAAIGVSTHSVEEARRAAREGADSIGVGPVFASSTKEAGPPLSPEGLRPLLLAADLPAFAIGGIGPENLPRVIAAGARRVAVSAGILAAGSRAGIEEAARAMRSLLDQAGPPQATPPAAPLASSGP
jgi:thiamine-phosphate pyrophosphorylase